MLYSWIFQYIKLSVKLVTKSRHNLLPKRKAFSENTSVHVIYLNIGMESIHTINRPLDWIAFNIVFVSHTISIVFTLTQRSYSIIILIRDSLCFCSLKCVFPKDNSFLPIKIVQPEFYLNNYNWRRVTACCKCWKHRSSSQY